jgi:hypothetical protein
MGRLSSAHSHEHACMPSNVSWRQPPSSAAPFVTLRARHRTARTGTRRDDDAPENARTDAHGMDCWCRYAPTARLVLRAARDFDALQSANASGMLFDVVTCRETRSSRPSPVFLNTILSRTTVKRWPRERASTLRLGGRFALQPTPEKLLKKFKPVFLSESCSWARVKSEATPPAHEYFAPRVPNPAQEQSPNAAPAALVVCNLPRACS